MIGEKEALNREVNAMKDLTLRLRWELTYTKELVELQKVSIKEAEEIHEFMEDERFTDCKTMEDMKLDYTKKIVYLIHLLNVYKHNM